MRYRQDLKTGKLYPVDEEARKKAALATGGIIVRGNFDAFVSIVDGTLISSHRDLEQHNKRNDVVSAQEFSPEYYAGKAKERERIYKADNARDRREAKMELNERIEQAIRKGR